MGRKSSTHKQPIQKHSNTSVALPEETIQPTPSTASNDDSFAALLESVAKPILAVTYWFDPEPYAEPYPVTVRFSGRRVDAKGRLHNRDRFVQDETIEKVVPGSGPVSVTARVHDINPGEWTVTAQVLASPHMTQKTRKQEQTTTIQTSGSGLLPSIWRRWAPVAASDEHLKTCLTPFAHVPGILPGIWAIMVVIGMIVAILFQWLVISLDHLALGPWLTVTLGAIAVGIVGAKVWYIVVYRSMIGWCIQGFVTGATLTAILLLLVFRIPLGVFLDMTAPGLLIAMAIGRVGCFFAGCCGGPPTASRWGVWSSDQRVGARRIPTQLMELTLALSLGIIALVLVLSRGPAGGAIFVSALAAYTLVRQGILRLRAEPRKSKLTGPLFATLSALVLVVAVVFLVR